MERMNGKFDLCMYKLTCKTYRPKGVLMMGLWIFKLREFILKFYIFIFF